MSFTTVQLKRRDMQANRVPAAIELVPGHLSREALLTSELNACHQVASGRLLR